MGFPVDLPWECESQTRVPRGGCAAPWPVIRLFAESGFYGVVTDVCSCVRKVILITDVAVVIILRPEVSLSSKQAVDLPGTECFPRFHKIAELGSFWAMNEDMDVVWHHAPFQEPVSVSIEMQKSALQD